MITLVFLLEEPSAREMLKGVLPKILPDNVCPRYIVFEGKQDLEKRLKKRLQGWMQPNSKFLVMRDQDAGDCYEIKKDLVKKCDSSGKVDVLVRIACKELESFYFGDLQAVEKGLDLDGIASRYQNKAKYRTPDQITNPSRELEQITENRYQKVSGSREIGIHLNPDANSSNSFKVLLDGIKSLTF